MAKTHGVSLMTARQALVSLEREGVVERCRGIGTFVAAPKIHFNKLRAYAEQLAIRSLIANTKVLCSRIVDNEEEVAARLALAPKSKIIGSNACEAPPVSSSRSRLAIFPRQSS